MTALHRTPWRTSLPSVHRTDTSCRLDPAGEVLHPLLRTTYIVKMLGLKIVRELYAVLLATDYVD